MKCFAALALSTLVAFYPTEHGYFMVSDGHFTADGRESCRVRGSALIEGHTIFALDLYGYQDGSPMVIIYVLNDPKILKADAVTIMLDNQVITNFRPQHRSGSAELNSLTYTVSGADEENTILRNLSHQSRHAKWLVVLADGVKEAIPATGLDIALRDLESCRPFRT